MPIPSLAVSAAGITTHEANLESNLDSFRGFPWLLRLRMVLEGASTLADAEKIWSTTNNTVGFNHMVASGNHVQRLKPGLSLRVSICTMRSLLLATTFSCIAAACML